MTATYPLKTISALLMLTDRRVQQLAADGVIPKTDRGRYELAPAVQGYIKYLKDRSVSGDVRSGGDAGDSDIDLTAERARKAQQEADKLTMQNEVMRGSLLKREDVDAAVIAAFARVRARMIGVPSKIAPVVVGMDQPAEIEAIARKAVYDALRELSETTVADLCGDSGEVVADPDPAAEPDDFGMGGRGEAT